jgi:hypothetical protein
MAVAPVPKAVVELQAAMPTYRCWKSGKPARSRLGEDLLSQAVLYYLCQLAGACGMQRRETTDFMESQLNSTPTRFREVTAF